VQGAIYEDLLYWQISSFPSRHAYEDTEKLKNVPQTLTCAT
jgi:hypothetical protein